jgi:hypothetical protein
MCLDGWYWEAWRFFDNGIEGVGHHYMLVMLQKSI